MTTTGHGPICGATAPTIGGFTPEPDPDVTACTFPPGHPRIVDGNGQIWDHGLIDDTTRWRVAEPFAEQTTTTTGYSGPVTPQPLPPGALPAAQLHTGPGFDWQANADRISRHLQHAIAERDLWRGRAEERRLAHRDLLVEHDRYRAALRDLYDAAAQVPIPGHEFHNAPWRRLVDAITAAQPLADPDTARAALDGTP